MASIERISEISYVVVRLMIEGEICWLLHWHPKWQDWSFLGGHVEPDEAGDWLRTAIRETNEELSPLVVGQDVRVAALATPRTSRARFSRSAGLRRTCYNIAWFYLEFMHSPRESLARLDPAFFALVREAHLLGGGSPESAVAQVVFDNVKSLIDPLEVVGQPALVEGALELNVLF